MFVRFRAEGRLRIDLPAVDAVRGARRAQVRVPASILHATEQQRRAVSEARRGGIEDRVRWIGPICGRENRISIVTMKKRFVMTCRFQGTLSPWVMCACEAGGVAEVVVAVPIRSTARISRSASKNDK